MFSQKYNPLSFAYNAIFGSLFLTISSISSSSLIYGGLLITTSNLSLIPSYILVLTKLITQLFFLAFNLATSKASVDISVAVTLELVSFFNEIAIAPEPVPISNISTLSNFDLINLIVLSTNSSVSNLGIKTFLLTSKSYPQKLKLKK